MALPAQRTDGSTGELQMDEYERLKVEKAEAEEPAEDALAELHQTDDGELLVGEGDTL